MPSLEFLVPGPIETLTGGYGYDRRMAAALRERGWSVAIRALDGSFPIPTAEALDDAGRVLAGLLDGAVVLVDGLAFGAMPDQAARHAGRLRLAALVHHPLASETGLDPATAARLEASERRALAAARLVIVTSSRTARALGPYGVAGDRIAIVEPGTDRAPLARGSRKTEVHLLCVAALVPRKGCDVLLRALAAIPERNWRLTCVGSLERDPRTAALVRELAGAGALRDRVSFAGEAQGAALDAHYDRADVFVLATRHEGYGMAVAEAIARGLPVVSTATGGIADLVGDEAGLVVPPGDERAFAEALSRLLADAELRDRLAAGARRVRNRLPTWADASRRLAMALESLRTGRKDARVTAASE